MAPRTVIRALSRTSVAVAALMVAVSVIIGVGVMIGSFRDTVETWLGEELVGGLYGIVAGTGFTGESMFTLKPNASKVAFHYLMMLARKMNWEFIDAQQDTPHIRTLGAEEVDFGDFYLLLTATGNE